MILGSTPLRISSFALIAMLGITIFHKDAAGASKQQVPARPWLTPMASTIPALSGGPEIPLSLPDAIGLSLRQNRSIKGILLQRVAERFNLRVAEDAFTPKLTVNAMAGRERTSSETIRVATINPVATVQTPIGTIFTLGWIKDRTRTFTAGDASTTANSSLDISVVQPLLRGGGLDVNMAPVRTARIHEKQNLLQVKATVSATITQIVHAYYQLLQNQEQIKIAHSSLQRANEVIDINNALVAAGRMARNDLIQAEAYAAQQELALLGAENALDSARLALLNLLALEPHTRIVATDPALGEETHLAIDKAAQIAFSQRPDYLSQLLSVETARIAVDVARNARKWDLALVASSKKNASDSSSADPAPPPINTSRSNYVGLQLSFQLGDLRPEQAEVQATTALKQAELQVDTLRANVEQTVRDGVRSIDILWRQYLLARRARDLAARTVSTELIKLRSGRSSNFQVRQSQDDLLNTENAELNARVAYVNVLADLDEHLGMTLETWQIELPAETY